MSCNFIRVEEKHLRSATQNFHIIFLRGDELQEDNRYRWQKDRHTATARLKFIIKT